MLPTSVPVDDDDFTEEEWQTLRRLVPMFYDALSAVSTVLTSETAASARMNQDIPSSCPQITFDPNNDATLLMNYGEGCTLHQLFATPIQGAIVAGLGTRTNEIELVLNEVNIAGYQVNGNAGLALSELDDTPVRITGNFRLVLNGRDTVRGILTLELRDRQIIIQNGFWLFEEEAVEFEVTDPTSNIPNGQILMQPNDTGRLIPQSGRVAFRATTGRFVVTFDSDTPATGAVTAVVDADPPRRTTLPLQLP